MKPQVRLLLAMLLLVTLTGCAGRNLHSDLHDDSRLMVRRWTFQTQQDWDAGDRGFEFSNSAFYENTLIFGSRGRGLTSIYPGLMQVRWTLPIHGGVVGEILLDKSSVYFGGSDGFVYSVNAENGQVNWKFEVRNSLVSRPYADTGRIFFTSSDDTVYALDAGTGKVLWHYRRRTSPLATVQGASQPIVDGNEVLAGLSDGFMVALSLPDGQLKWERKLQQGSKFTDVDAHPVVESGVIYVPSYDGALYALKRQNGEPIWRFDAGGSKQVIIDGSRLFFPSNDGFVYCLDKASAKILWKFELDSGTPTQLISSDRTLAVGSSFQYLYLVDKSTGQGVYRFNAGWGSGFSGAPAFDPVSQKLYLLSGAGNLYAFEMRRPPRKIRPHGMTEPYDN